MPLHPTDKPVGYLELSTGRYPVSQSQIRAENPQTSFPAGFPTPPGYAVVFPAPAPAFDPVTQIAREIAPVLTSKGHYEQAYEVVEKYDNQEDKDAAIAANLASKKTSKITQINTLRDTKETDGFVYSGNLFQSDERSAARIANAALTASTALATGQPFTVDWGAADNTTVTLDGTGMLGMQAALTQRAAVLHYYSRSLKDAVTAATNATELDAIDINSGWPEL